MVEQNVTFALDGKDYTGVFELLGHGETAAVSVRFGDNSISAFSGHLPPEVVARTLLGELVRAKLLEDGSVGAVRRAARGDASEPLHYRYSRPVPSAPTAKHPATRMLSRSTPGLTLSSPMAR